MFQREPKLVPKPYIFGFLNSRNPVDLYLECLLHKNPLGKPMGPLGPSGYKDGPAVGYSGKLGVALRDTLGLQRQSIGRCLRKFQTNDTSMIGNPNLPHQRNPPTNISRIVHDGAA